VRRLLVHSFKSSWSKKDVTEDLCFCLEIVWLVIVTVSILSFISAITWFSYTFMLKLSSNDEAMLWLGWLVNLLVNLILILFAAFLCYLKIEKMIDIRGMEKMIQDPAWWSIVAQKAYYGIICMFVCFSSIYITKFAVNLVSSMLEKVGHLRVLHQYNFVREEMKKYSRNALVNQMLHNIKEHLEDPALFDRAYHAVEEAPERKRQRENVEDKASIKSMFKEAVVAKSSLVNDEFVIILSFLTVTSLTTLLLEYCPPSLARPLFYFLSVPLISCLGMVVLAWPLFWFYSLWHAYEKERSLCCLELLQQRRDYIG